MPVPDLIVARNRHLRLASFPYRAVSPGHTVLLARRTEKWQNRARVSPVSMHRIVATPCTSVPHARVIGDREDTERVHSTLPTIILALLRFF